MNLDQGRKKIRRGQCSGGHGSIQDADLLGLDEGVLPEGGVL